MTRDEVAAIETAILKGIETAIETMIVSPFPKDGEPSQRWAMAHAKVRGAVNAALSRILTKP